MKIIDWILELLFPSKCTFCRELLVDKHAVICPKCKKDLPYTKNGGILKGNFFTACISPLYYEEKVRDALLRYKFQRMTVYADCFGGMIAECAEEYIDSHVDIISWVPLSKRRLRKRGYDQAQLLAIEVSNRLGIPCIPTLKKIRHTKPQSRTGNASRRRTNISGAYTAINIEAIEGKRILLIDDIVTTGSTFSECARMLGMAGADRVYCAAAARKRKD